MVKNLLVTGSCGRLGKRIVNAFSSDFHVIGLDVLPPQKDSGIEHYYPVDLGSDVSVQKAFEEIQKNHGTELASCIHLAAHYSFGKQDWEPYQRITIDGTKRLLSALKSFHVEQFVFSSTQLVYAPSPLGEKVHEQSQVDPKWAYPASKVITEQEILKEHGEMPVCILRFAGIYDDFCHSIPLSHQIQRIYENRLEKHFFPGNLKHGAPFLHMDDFIEAVRKTVAKRGDLPKELILLLGEPKSHSYGEIQRLLGKLILGKEFSTYRIPKFIAKMGAWVQNHLPFYPEPFIKPWMIDLSDDHYELDISFSKGILGWEPKYSVVETLPKMIEALKKDPQGWYKEHNLS